MVCINYGVDNSFLRQENQPKEIFFLHKVSEVAYQDRENSNMVHPSLSGLANKEDTRCSQLMLRRVIFICDQT